MPTRPACPACPPSLILSRHTSTLSFLTPTIFCQAHSAFQFPPARPPALVVSPLSFYSIFHGRHSNIPCQPPNSTIRPSPAQLAFNQYFLHYYCLSIRYHLRFAWPAQHAHYPPNLAPATSCSIPNFSSPALMPSIHTTSFIGLTETPLNLDFSVQIRQHASSPCVLSTINFIGHSFYITVDFLFFVWPKYLFLPGDVFHQITSTSISLVRFCLSRQRCLFTTSPTLPNATLPLSPHISRSLTVIHTASLHPFSLLSLPSPPSQVSSLGESFSLPR